MLPAKWRDCCREVRVLPSPVCNSDHFAVETSLMLPRAPADDPQAQLPRASLVPGGKNAGRHDRKRKPVGWRCKDLSSLHSFVLDKLEGAKTLDEFNSMVKGYCFEAGDPTPKQNFYFLWIRI